MSTWRQYDLPYHPGRIIYLPGSLIRAHWTVLIQVRSIPSF